MKKSLLFFMLLSALWWGGTETVQAEIKNGECSAEGANVTWTLDTETGKLEISGTGEMKDFESFDETPWFDYSSVITSVTVGNGVTAVGNYAFSDCTELTNLRIEDNADTLNIKRYAFTNCPLDTVYLGRNIVAWIRQGLVKLRTYPFSLKTSLVSLTIGNQVTAINRDAFCGCTSLTNLRIEDSAETLEFTDCSEEHMPFADCPLDTVYLGRNISYDSNYSPFKDKRNLVSLTIGNQVTVINRDAFCGCTSRTNLRIEDSAETLEFTDCSEEHMPFADCPLDTVYLGRNISYDSNYSPFKDKTSLVSLTIGTQVTAIGEYTFSGCTYLTSVTIPESVTTIGDRAFSGCSELMTSVTIPTSVTTIGEAAFYGCAGLTSVTIGDGVTTIGDGVFSGCSGLPSVTIPNSVTAIGNDAFSGCTALRSITLYAINPPEIQNSSVESDVYVYVPAESIALYKAAEGWKNLNIKYKIDGIGYDILSSDERMAEVINGEYSGDVVIPETMEYEGITYRVTAIGDYAFYYCTDLTSVTIPESVTTIGDDAFYYCTDLTSVTIPESVISIGDWAFGRCRGLTSVTIPNSVTTIGDFAFLSCDGLTSVTIPENVTVIGEGTFLFCDGLTSVTIPESVTAIGSDAFNCSGLTSITIPDGVTSIGDYTFAYCFGLHEVTIGDGVTSIGDSAFYNCSGLTSITIPDGVTSIGEYAFGGCDDLTSVTAYNPIPVDIGSYVFRGVDCANCTLYVPAESVELYSAAEGWKEFGTILPIVAYDFEAAPTITPTENDETITALSTFTLAFDERPALVDSVATVMKADSSAYYPARITASEDGKSFIIALQGNEQTKAAEYSLTEAGTYLLVIPAGTFGDDDFAADPKTGHSNPELTYTYTIKEPEPVEPDEPENPDTPDEPEVPDEPDEPIVPDEPDEPSSITETPSDAGHIAVYNLQGVLVLETDDAADLKTLQNGAYIVNGKTMIIAR